MNTVRFGMIAGVAVSLLGSCASNETRVDAMSAEEHRAKAQQEEQLAQQDEALYEAKIHGRGPAHELMTSDLPPSARVIPLPTETPAIDDLQRAERHRAHAQAHEADAAALEDFEDVECASVPAPERSACPLLGPVARLDDIPGGVRVQLARVETWHDVLTRMQCHLAFARSRGFGRVFPCPLYERGLQVEAGPNPGQIDLLTSDSSRVGELRKQVRLEVTFAGDTSASR
jgi:hypothetical protein